MWSAVSAFLGALLALTGTPPPAAAAPHAGECVILLHGLARTERAMEPMAGALQAAGYAVVNQRYPSREHPIGKLAAIALPQALTACRAGGAKVIHVVTHSLGGIVLREYLAGRSIPELGRVVMLSPPNEGSELVDKLGELPGFRLAGGPAVEQLGTGPDSVPMTLGPARFVVGVITGTASVNPILSQLIPGPDDGKVAVERARLEGMADFLTVPYSHPFIMRRPEVIRETLRFLAHGHFAHEPEQP